MQIALCHENVLPRRGGAEMYVADLARRLVAAGHDVRLYASKWDSSALPPSMTVHQIPRAGGRRRTRPWRFSEALQSKLLSHRPQVSIGFDKVLGTDVYYPLGGLHIACADHNVLKQPPGIRRWFARIGQRFDGALHSFLKLERQLIRSATRPLIIANSNFVRDHACKYFGLDSATIPVIHNAVDPVRFDEHDRPAIRIDERRRLNLNEDDAVGVIIAMNYRLKGLDPLLNAIKLLPRSSQFRLVVAGSSKTKPWQRKAKKLGIDDRVRFIGHCSDVRRALFVADFLVHPTFYDPCSLVVLEAMTCGLPVITTKYNGAAELIPAEGGSVIGDPHDSHLLAVAIKHWCDADSRRIGSLAARNAARRWTFDHHVRALESVLRQIPGRLKSAG